jgi:hypothetical protein
LSQDSVLWLAALIFAAALLYASVGHGGASGYLAALALFGVAPEVMKPTALLLNILVSALAGSSFARAGLFDWKLFWPFALFSVPCAFIGGAIQAPSPVYKTIVGLVLLCAAARFLVDAAAVRTEPARPPPHGIAFASGSAIGLLSGLTGVGGGIFLTPLLLFAGWADTRRAGAVSAAFILVNSIAGLGGHLASLGQVPSAIRIWAPAALAGGLIGSRAGSRYLGTPALRRVLAAVLIVAGLKLVLTG